MRLAAALAFASVLLVATEAHASGGYGNSIATPLYCYTFNEHVHKRFVDGEQARAYMKDHDRFMKARFLAFQAKAERAVKKSGLPIAPFDLFLPAVHLGKARDVSKIDRKAYPLNLIIDLGNEEADELFEVTLTKPVTATQVAALRSALKGAVKIREVEDDGSGEQEAKEQALIDAAQFEAPVAVIHVDELFGLYVGTTTEVAAADRERVVTSLRAMLDKLLPKVRESFAAPDIATRLNLEGLHATETKTVDAKRFNPWGPLASAGSVRVNIEMGRVSAILTIAPVGKHEWSKVYPVMETILNDAGADDAHRALIESESERLDGIER